MEYTLVSGSSFKDFYEGVEFYKIVSQDDTHKTIKLKDGLNEISLTQYATGYINGGINFCDWDNFFPTLKISYNAKYIRRIGIIDDSQVFIDNKEYVTDKVMLGEKILIEDLKEWDDKEFCEKALKSDFKNVKYIRNIELMSGSKFLEFVKKDPYCIEHIKNQTEEMQLLAVNHSGYLLRHCANPSLNVIMIGIKKAPYSIKYLTIDENMLYDLVKNDPSLIEHTNELPEGIYCEVLKKNGMLLKHINKQTQLLCDIAFENNIESFRFVKKQFKTYEMCLKAVGFNPDLLDFVSDDNFTHELCMIAVKKKGLTIKYIINPSVDTCMEALNNDLTAIHQISKPTDEMLVLALKKFPHLHSRIQDKSLITGEENINCVLNTTPMHIQNIKNPTYAQCLIAVKKSSKVFEHIPKEHHTDELCMTAIHDYPEVLQFIDNQTETMAIAGVLQKGSVLKFIKNKNYDLNIAAVENDGMALEHVDIQTDDIVKAALKQNIKSFKFVKNKTVEVCKYAVSVDPMLLKEIIDPFSDQVNEEIVLEALKKKGEMLRFIAQSAYTEKMCKLALDSNIEMMSLIPEKFQTEELVLPALAKKGTVLVHIKKPTYKMCQMALNNDIETMLFVPDSFQTEEFVLPYLMKKGSILRHIKNKTMQMCKVALDNDSDAMAHVPIEHQTEELVLPYLEKNGLLLKHIKNQTDKMCFTAIKNKPLAIEFVINQTEELGLYAIKLNCNTLRFIKNQTPEMCMRAVQQDFYAMFHVKNQNLMLCIHCTILNPKSTIYISEYDTRKKCENVVSDIKTQLKL